MSEAGEAGAAVSADGVPLERAEPDKPQGPPPGCGFCKRPLGDQYWQIAKRPTCTQCRSSLERELVASTSRQAYLRALRYGSLAAVASSIGWIVITKVTGYEIGVVAIAVGFFVGKSVRKGAGGFGAPRYQYLAMFLTYSAIALASLPAIFEAIAHSSSHQAPQPPSHASVGGVLWAWLVILAFAYASPFLGGLQSIMGLFIIAIGLWEAWKLTRELPIEVRGPFSLADKPPT